MLLHLTKRYVSCVKCVADNMDCRWYSSVTNLLEKWNIIFVENKVSEPQSSIKNIMCHTLGLKNLSLVDYRENDQLNDAQVKRFEKMCLERINGKPVQYVIGEWDFCNLNLKMKPPILIPRPETEELVEICKRVIYGSKKSQLDVLDVGCGTGCIALEILHSCPQAFCTAVDQNPEAIELTNYNALDLSLTDKLESLVAQLENSRIKELSGRKYDVIISNPPYIPTSQMEFLQKEIAGFEDDRALHGGCDGLDIIKQLVQFAAATLHHDGHLLMEVGDDQSHKVVAFIDRYMESILKMHKTSVHKDFMGVDRFVITQIKE